MKLTRITTGVLVVGLLLSFSSCIDSDYDLNKNIDLNINVGSNLGLPIGETDTIRLSELIEESDILHAIDGKYVISESDHITEHIDAVEDVLIEDFDPEFTSIDREFEELEELILPNIPGLSNPDITLHLAADLSTSGKFDEQASLPKEVKDLEYLYITDGNGKTLHTTIGINISGIPDAISELHFIGVELDIPETLDFHIEENENMVRQGNSIFFTQDVEITNGNGYISFPLDVYGFANPTIKGDSIYLSDEISLKGKIYADARIVNSDQLKGVVVSILPNIKLPTPDLRISKIAGTIVPDVDLNTSISLGDLPDFLKEEDTTVELKEVSINLSMQNPVDAPIYTKLQIIPKDKQGNIINNVLNVALNIEAGEYCQFHLTNNSPEITGGSLTSLLNNIPEEIEITIPELKIASQDKNHTIALGTDYNVSFDYDIEVPLAFNNIHIAYSDTIEGLQSDLKDFDFIKHLELITTIDNALPARLNLSIDARDIDGDPISGLSYPEAITIEAAPDNEGTVRSTTCNLVIKEEREAALKELDKLYIHVEGSNEEGNHNVTLRPDQFMIIRMSAKLPDGIHVDLEKDF